MNAQTLHPRPSEPMVHLVDDEAPVRDALTFLFQSHGLAVRAYASGPEFLDAADEAPLAGCIVLDVRMEPMSGLQVHDALVARGSGVPVLFLTGHGDIPMAVEAMQNGAFDFLQKPFRDQDLIDRVQRALERDASTRTQLKATDKIREHLETLTPREREVLDLVTAGKPNKVMAADLGVSQRTIEIHRARVMEKMQARSLAQLVRMVLDLRQPVSESHSSGQSSG